MAIKNFGYNYNPNGSMFNSPFSNYGVMPQDIDYSSLLYGRPAQMGNSIGADYNSTMNNLLGFNAVNPTDSFGYHLGGIDNMYSNAATGAVGGVSGIGGMWNKFKAGFGEAMGTPDKPGWGAQALNVASGLGNAWMGMKQYGLAKDQYNLAKEYAAKNYAAQRQTINSSLEDRQRARVASNPGAYQSVGSYMNQWGVK